MSDLKVQADDIAVGKALPWPMFDSEGRLLLKKGTVIEKQSMLEALVSRGLYRRKKDAVSTSADEEQVAPFEEQASPLSILDELIHKLPEIFEQIIARQGNVEKKIMKLVASIQGLCEQDADAMIGAVHIQRTTQYIYYHPVHVAVLSELVGKRLGMSEQERALVLAAALVSNISMLELQDQLYKQEKPLTPEQQQAITQHPSESVKLLVANRVYNAKLLEIVMQHHERPDGNGYPGGLKGEMVCREAQLVSIADRYAAMVSGREYRNAKPSSEALKQFFQDRCAHCDEAMTLLFIKDLGIWPPGTPVKLVNGEVAIVTHRIKDSMWPKVNSIISPRGGPYARPLVRDCELEEYRIKEVTRLKEGIPLNLSMLWGYC